MKKKIVWVFLILSHVLMGMEDLSMEKKDDKIFSPQEIVFSLVTLYYLDHKSNCHFGSTSKCNNDLMIKLAETRKKILGNIPEITQSPLNAWYQGGWHEYGSVYRCVYVRSHAEKKVLAKIYMLLSSLRRTYRSDTYLINHTNDYIHPLPCKILPCYSGDNGYFYGVKKRAIPYQYEINYSRVYESISIYRFIFDGPGLECRISISNEQSWGLKFFLDYPRILKAILNSTVISKKKKMYINFDGKQKKRAYWDYSLEGITIPKDYQQYIKNIDSMKQTAKWNFLDQVLRKAIDIRYQEQHSGI